MIEIDVLVTAVSLIATIVSILVAGITLYDRRRIKEGIKSTNDTIELELKKREIDNKNQLEQQKLELEKKRHETREKWKNFELGLKLLDLISRISDDEEYEEDVEE